MNAETRTFIPHVDPMTLRVMDFRDERLRLAQFRYSATVMAGSKPSFRFIDEPYSESDHEPASRHPSTV
jgi:D-Tyr-tRNAtyr deacylase